MNQEPQKSNPVDAKKASISESAIVPYSEKAAPVKKDLPHSGSGLAVHDLVSIQSIMNRQLAAVSAQLGEMATLNQKIDQLLLSHLGQTQ